jgi:arthrofactin-type cyclic lipopeptide synthetase C
VAEEVASRAKATPDAAAILAGERRVSYAELNATANGLADRMIKIGIGREDVVAVHARRSVETLTAMLAVLKAGGAFLPLDPGDPRARVAAVLDDAAPRAILVNSQHHERLQGLGIPLIKPGGEPA